MLYRKVLVLMCSIILTFNLYNNAIQLELKQNKVGIIISNNFEQPLIDGKLELKEWNVSEPIAVLLYGRENREYTLEIEIRSIYNEKTGNITVGVEIPQKEIGPLNYIVMFFHTNKSFPLLSMVDSHLTAGKNNDIKEIYFNSNSSRDGYTGGHEIVKWPDSEGNNFGKCYDAGDTITAEMCFPLNSGDYEGGDIKLMKGQEVDFFIFYMNTLYDNESTAYYQYDEITKEYDVCTLKIAGKIEMTAFYAIFIVIFVILGISSLSYITKKNK